jgi:glycosyltransferase involved in cell wall biosynthesis
VTLVYDVDGLNPYGRELALLVGGRALTAYDAEWRPPGTRAVLPANRTSPGRWLQLLRLLHGLALCGLAALRRQTVVVVLTRSVLDDVVLGLLARVGRVVVVVHDPVPKRPPQPARARSYAFLCRGAVRVAHSASLAEQAGGAAVCGHLPFREWCAAYGASSRGDALLVLGHLRPDKGLDRLPDALHGVPSARLVVCGRGPLDAGVRDALGEVVTVDDRSTVGFAPDADVAAALRDARVLVATYRTVSQSGSVALAVSAGLGAVAYGTGALADLPGVATVPDGDAAAFAAAVTRALAAPREPVDVDAWAGEVLAQWRAVL